MADRLKRRRNATKSNLMKVILPRVEELLESGVPQDEDSKLELATSKQLRKIYLKSQKNLIYLISCCIFVKIEDNEIEAETAKKRQFSL